MKPMDEGHQAPQTYRAFWLKRVAVLLLLVTVFSLSALTVVYWTLRGRTVEVPNVISYEESEAQDRLEDDGLIMRVRSRIPHADIPAGQVCDQSPRAGTTVKSGQIVRVSLSLGAPVALPTRSD
ncbi:MAG: PASTA domain-containing protein [Blastocatellia bacterium]